MTDEIKTDTVEALQEDADLEPEHTTSENVSRAAAPEDTEATTAGETKPAEAAAEPAEPEADPAESEAVPAEPERVAPRRQSLVLRTGSCDMRVGQGTIEILGQAVKAVAAHPRLALLVSAQDVCPELTETCRRNLVDTGYDVRLMQAPSGRAGRNVSFTNQLMARMAQEGITADDPVIVIGSGDLISGALFVTSTWYAGCVLVAIPTTLEAMVDVLGTPRSVDIDGAKDVLLARGNVRLALCDLDLLDAQSEAQELGYATMVAGALISGEKSFSELALAADKILAGDPEALTQQIMDISKARARVASSTALAMRQGVLYGVGIARALSNCLAEQSVDAGRYVVDENPSAGRILAEGLRIAARLGAAYKPEDSSVLDLVFTQDGLLDKFGLSEIACVLDPEQLLEQLRAVEFVRQNRFMPAIPLAYGRVRMTTLDDALLAEHINAWCKSRRKLARRRAKEAQGE